MKKLNMNQEEFSTFRTCITTMDVLVDTLRAEVDRKLSRSDREEIVIMMPSVKTSDDHCKVYFVIFFRTLYEKWAKHID